MCLFHSSLSFNELSCLRCCDTIKKSWLDGVINSSPTRTQVRWLIIAAIAALNISVWGVIWAICTSRRDALCEGAAEEVLVGEARGVIWPCLNPVLAALAAGASPPWSAAPSSLPSWTATCSRHGNRHRTHTDADNVGYTVVSSGPGSAVFDLKNKQSTLAPLLASHKAIMALEFSVGQKCQRSFYMQLFHRLTLWKHAESFQWLNVGSMWVWLKPVEIE